MTTRWEDTTSYSRSDKDRTPREWTLKLPLVGQIVVHGHIYEPGAWFVTARDCGLYRVRLVNVTDGETAKERALLCVRDALESKLAEVRKVLP